MSLNVEPFSFDTEGTEVWTLTVTLVDDLNIQADIVAVEEIEILYTGIIKKHIADIFSFAQFENHILSLVFNLIRIRPYKRFV